MQAMPLSKMLARILDYFRLLFLQNESKENVHFDLQR